MRMLIIAIICLMNTCLMAQDASNTAVIPARACEKDFYDWPERHEAVCQAIHKGPVNLVFLGDSITHLWGGSPKPNRQSGDRVWQEYYGKRDAINMGFGWDRTQQVLWRVENGEFEGITPQVAVVLIGTNNLVGHAVRENTNDEIVSGIGAVCQSIRKRAPKTNVLLLGLFPRGEDATNPLRKRILNINLELAKLDGKEGVTFLDIGPKFLDSNGKFLPDVAPDHLHLSERGYRLWAESMEPTLAKLFQE